MRSQRVSNSCPPDTMCAFKLRADSALVMLCPEAVLPAEDGGRLRAESGRRALQPSELAVDGRADRAEDGRAGGLDAWAAPGLCWPLATLLAA
mmetsp:Transcript_87568/g.261196  ORF Transcript_87568/g.261196 Transcript_87568/m.261196 type:complete len:93 (-) Transcript_87568:146-424(-)